MKKEVYSLPGVTMSVAQATTSSAASKDNVVGEDHAETEEKTSKRKKTSKVWDDITQVDVNGTKKAKCNHCGILLSLSQSSATSHLSRHLRSCAAFAAFKSGNQGNKGLVQSLLSLGGDGSCLTNYKYDKERVKDIMTKMIIVHDYPFMMGNHELFTLYSKALNPRFEPIKRHAIKDHCIHVYNTEKIKLKSQFASIGRVSFTSDLWTSNQTIGYMCLTAHYVDSEWTLQDRLINFCRLPPPHTGIVIADKIFDCLSSWGLEDKVSTITLDNASSNDAAVRHLKEELRIRGKLFFGGKIFHLRCCAHILNLLVQDGLSVISDIIHTVRESVKYVTLTPSRLHKFKEIVTQISLKTNSGLILDVPTRWNSTYNMLKRALIFKDVFPLYKKRDSVYNWLPTDDDWSRAAIVCKFLEVFDNVTKLFSGSKYPTSNLFFGQVWKIKQLLDEMSSSKEDYMIVMVLKMKEKFDKYWGECSLLMAIGAAMDPRNKLVFIQFVFRKLYPPVEGDPCPTWQKKIDEVREALMELYSDYASRASETSSIGETSTTGDSENVIHNGNEFYDWAKEMNAIEPSRNEMDVYLEETFLKNFDPKFNVLDWWKLNTLKFPILSMMARDILSIPVTTVASESSFSVGRRVLDDHRSSMKPDTLEALLCTGNWLRREYGIETSTNDEINED